MSQIRTTKYHVRKREVVLTCYVVILTAINEGCRNCFNINLFVLCPYYETGLSLSFSTHVLLTATTLGMRISFRLIHLLVCYFIFRSVSYMNNYWKFPPWVTLNMLQIFILCLYPCERFAILF
jgi:hypothetical protein